MSSRQERPGHDPGALSAAVRAAARFDRTLVSVGGGLLAAVPVVAALGAGVALGDPVKGVIVAAGAMLVGIAWRVSGGRPPLVLMAVDALIMAISTFVGCVTGSVLWLHIAVLCLWSLAGGLLVGVGNRGGVLGMQAIIAVVVFGRFTEPAPAALGLAGLVLLGGLAQVVFLSIIRWPLPLRAQRTATAAAYRALADLAGATGEVSSLAAGAALDGAADRLSTPALLGDPAVMTLRSLVSEGHRLRIALMALHGLRRQQEALASADPPTDTPVDAARPLHLTARMLQQAARAIEGDSRAARELEQSVAALTREADEEAEFEFTPATGSFSAEATALQISRRAAALAGQGRAIGSLAPAAGRGGGLRSRRPFSRTNHPLARLRGYTGQVRANASLQSPAGRHALRLAVIVPAATVIARGLPLDRSYWLVVAAATTLRPEFGATFTRGTERAVGTCLGVALAGGIAVAAHPAGGVTVALVGVLAFAAYAVFPASFALGFAFITALVVFLLNAVSPDTLATAGARLLDTLIGGTIGLLVYALWPTWAHGSAWQSLADLVAAERAYINGVLRALIEGRRASEAQMTALARRARLVRTRAEATVAASLSEPAIRRIDARQSQGALGVLRRLVQAAHVLRLDAQDERERHPVPELEPLRSGIDGQLGAVERLLQSRAESEEAPAVLPDLRALHQRFERDVRENPDGLPLVAELDEIVDAANGLAAVLGMEAVDEDPQTEQERVSA
ncbi:MAG TPA: FUSC family protein [Solirubrobacteraceae bacterium]|nr:FUSC family protein [Solirubrobacteraceae bacterium]